MGNIGHSPLSSLGLRFELLCAALLESLVREEQLREWSWGKKIEGLSTRPDFIIGAPTEPDVVLFVSHGGRGGDGHKKFWRDLGELFALRRRWREPPLLIRICFEVSMKRPLELRRAQLFDGSISVMSQRGGAALIRWVECWRAKRSARDQLWRSTPLAGQVGSVAASARSSSFVLSCSTPSGAGRPARHRAAEAGTADP